MSKRGPRGDISRDLVLAAAMAVLEREGRIEKVSLRMVAREVGVAPNAIYTYFPSMQALWCEARERQLALLLDSFTPSSACPRQRLAELLRGIAQSCGDTWLELFSHWTYEGAASVRFAETVLELTEAAKMPSHNARNLVLIWLTGKVTLLRDRTLVPEVREQVRRAVTGEFPREAAANGEPTDRLADFETELQALLNGLELPCDCRAGSAPGGEPAPAGVTH